MNSTELIRTIKLFDFIDKIVVRSMFGGKRLFTNGVPFCQFYNGKFYFRTNADNNFYFNARGFEQLVTFKNDIEVRQNYFVVPEEEIIDRVRLQKRLETALKESLQDKEDALNNLRIRDLPNLRLQVERSLAKVGISTVSELRKQGEIVAFIKLRQANENVPIELLYSLSAALKGIHKSVLSSHEKNLLRLSIETMT